MEPNISKTIWKKKLFSDTDQSADKDFDTLHMMNKIARANKKKKKKAFNYKNIEEFENIYEEPNSARKTEVQKIAEPLQSPRPPPPTPAASQTAYLEWLGNINGLMSSAHDKYEANKKLKSTASEAKTGSTQTNETAKLQQKIQDVKESAIKAAKKPEIYVVTDPGNVDGTHSKIIDDKGTWIDASGNPQIGFFDETDGRYFVIDRYGQKHLYRGPMDPDTGIPLTPDFWDGLDSGDKGMSADDPRKMFLAYLQMIEKKIDDFNTEQTVYIANGLQQAIPVVVPTIITANTNILMANNVSKIKQGYLVTGDGIPVNTIVTNVNGQKITTNNNATASGNKYLSYYQNGASQADIDIIKPYISLLESVIFAYIFTYNLLYATAFIDSDTNKTVPMPKFTSDELKLLTLNPAIGFMAKPLVFLFTYALYFSDMLQTLLYDKLPYYFKKYLNIPIYMMFVFSMMILFLENCRPFLFKFIRDVIMLNTDNQIVNVMYALTILFFFADFDIFSPIFKNIFNIVSSIFSFGIKYKQSEIYPDKKEKDKKEKDKKEPTHKHGPSCNQCGMVSLNLCGGCGLNICGQCKMSHNCSKKEDNSDMGWFNNLFGNFDHLFDWLNGFNTATPTIGKTDMLAYNMKRVIDMVMGGFVTGPLMTLIQFIIVLSISVPLGLVFCIIVLLLMSTSMFWQPFTTLSLPKIINMWAIPFEINDFIQKAFLLNFDVTGDNLSPVELAKKIIAIFMDFVTSSMLSITFFVIAILAILDFKDNISNTILKQNLTIIVGTFTACIGIMICANALEKYKQERYVDPEEFDKLQEFLSESPPDQTGSQKGMHNSGIISGFKNKLSALVSDGKKISSELGDAKDKMKENMKAAFDNPVTKLAKGVMGTVLNPSAALGLNEQNYVVDDESLSFSDSDSSDTDSSDTDSSDTDSSDTDSSTDKDDDDDDDK